MEYKVGDKIERIGDTKAGVKKGQVYIIEELYENQPGNVKLKGLDGVYRLIYFKKLNSRNLPEWF